MHGSVCVCGLHPQCDDGDKCLFGIEASPASPELAEGLSETKLGDDGTGYAGGGACGRFCSNAGK